MIIENNILNKIPLTEGGEGIIYLIDNNTILKVFKDVVNKKEKINKIKKLLNKKLPKSIVAPIDIAYNNKNEFIGYTMRKIDGEDFKRLTNKKFIVSNNINNKDILKMLIDVQDTINKLHKQNIFIGDLNDGNILFDNNFNIYFIDCDSWTIDNYKCTVAMDSFKDPLLATNDFNEKTDNYSFSILAFKSLTRLHPFGGTTNPYMDLIDRMKKGISVIDNNTIIIPKNIKKWNYLSPILIQEFKQTFENNYRGTLSLKDLYDNLQYCNIDKIYYYSKYNECPLCNENAKIKAIPIKLDSINGIPLTVYFTSDEVDILLNENMYINHSNEIVYINSERKLSHENGENVFYTKDPYTSNDIIIRESNNKFIISSNEGISEFDKKYKTSIVVIDNIIYFISNSNMLEKLTCYEYGNDLEHLCKCSNQAYFEIYNNHYCVINKYENNIIICIDGANSIINNKMIEEYGIHYDIKNEEWLIIIKDSKLNYTTYVYKDNTILYQDDSIKYNCNLNNICIYNGTIFSPNEKAIRGFSYQKNVYKDFECPVVDYDSKIIRNNNKFKIINEKEIYIFG